MFRVLLLPLISAGMMMLATWHIVSRQKPVEQIEAPMAPPVSGFVNQIAGSGIIEPASENISVGSDVPGIVAKVLVKVGQIVAPGTPLVQIDDELISADVDVRRAELQVAEAELLRLEQMPRPEDLPPIAAQRREAEALVAQSLDAFERTSKLRVGNSSTEAELVSTQTRYEAARARLEQIAAEEKRLRAGAWSADKAVTRAKAANARAALRRLEAAKGRYTIRVLRSTRLSILAIPRTLRISRPVSRQDNSPSCRSTSGPAKWSLQFRPLR